MRPLPVAHPGTPPLTSAPAFLWWVARRQGCLLLAGAALGTTTSVAQAALPYLLGRTVDTGLADGLSQPLLLSCLLLLGVGAVQAASGVVGHRVDVENWLRAAFRTSQLVGHHVSRTGDAVTDELPTGEVVATVATDSLRLGELYYSSARVVGGLVAYIVVAFLLLSSSTVLGVAVLVGIPAVAAVLAAIVRPLHRRQAAHREASGRLTTLGADTVAGLRILRGIGGEEVFAARYRTQSQTVRQAGVRVAHTQSFLDALQVLLPGLLVAGVVWFGARLALSGEITPGQLVTFYGYAAFLSEPLTAATKGVEALTRALVGSRRILRVLRVPVTGADPELATASESSGADLHDDVSGLYVRAGSVTALVSADPDQTARIATRIGWLTDGHAEHVRLGGVPLPELGRAQVRRRIVVAESTAHLFASTLRDGLGPVGTSGLLEALHVADAGDVLDSIPGGLDGHVEERGRSLSGGQRQRVALARALLAEPEVLVLVDPTSAVDAHTEARIAGRLVRARAGRTTVIATTSPLVLDQVDQVVLVVAGRVAGAGTHRDLVRGQTSLSAAYRAVVDRATGATTGEVPIVAEEDVA